MHASFQIGNSIIMLNDEMPEWGTFGPKHLKGSPVTIHLYVENADGVFDQAVRAGAKITMPLDDMFWGDRYGSWKTLLVINGRSALTFGTSARMRCKKRWNRWAPERGDRSPPKAVALGEAGKSGN